MTIYNISCHIFQKIKSCCHEIFIICFEKRACQADLLIIGMNFKLEAYEVPLHIPASNRDFYLPFFILNVCEPRMLHNI